MNTCKVCIVVGTRPEVIKMAPVYNELRQSAYFEPILLSTGQHRELLDQSLAVFGLKPDYDLGVMRKSQSLTESTAKILEAASAYLKSSRPECILVQGDTTTVLGCALAAFYNNIPIGHVEAGLRTGDMLSPWPEEMNRRLVSPLCRWNFVPTMTSLRNLTREGIDSTKCFVTGNTVVDALLWARSLVKERDEIGSDTATRLGIPASFSGRYFGRVEQSIVLMTGHRRESFGDGFDSICFALKELVGRNPRVGIVFPMHLNPMVREPVLRILGNHPQISLIEPVSYLDMIWLMQQSRFIISDSGGVQEEAPSLGKPVLVTRETTERPEGIESGTCRLVGTDIGKILFESQLLLDSDEEVVRRSQIANPYGDGSASIQIRRILEHSFFN